MKMQSRLFKMSIERKAIRHLQREIKRYRGLTIIEVKGRGRCRCKVINAGAFLKQQSLFIAINYSGKNYIKKSNKYWKK